MNIPPIQVAYNIVDNLLFKIKILERLYMRQ